MLKLNLKAVKTDIAQKSNLSFIRALNFA
uniref:Uncharacterized protein n=1 Tax=Anguilla anguilla TaxID=7936 RepID=A0A0E9VC56_ANGAN